MNIFGEVRPAKATNQGQTVKEQSVANMSMAEMYSVWEYADRCSRMTDLGCLSLVAYKSKPSAAASDVNPRQNRPTTFEKIIKRALTTRKKLTFIESYLKKIMISSKAWGKEHIYQFNAKGKFPDVSCMWRWKSLSVKVSVSNAVAAEVAVVNPPKARMQFRLAITWMRKQKSSGWKN